jgi:hypothetical protein
MCFPSFVMIETAPGRMKRDDIKSFKAETGTKWTRTVHKRRQIGGGLRHSGVDRTFGACMRGGSLWKLGGFGFLQDDAERSIAWTIPFCVVFCVTLLRSQQFE